MPDPAPLPTAKVDVVDVRRASLPVAKVPEGSGTIGAPGPTLPLAVANDGSWVALCQARADTDGVPGIAVTTGYHGELGGDAMLPYFIRGGGLGAEIDQLVAVSEDTKRVAFIQKGELVIFDATKGTTTSVQQPDLRGMRANGGPSTLSFSADARFAVFFRPRGDSAAVVIRDLTAETEREVTLPKGTPWAVVPDDIGPWARLYALVDDTNGDGKITPPQVETNRAKDRPCVGPAVSYSEYGMSGDRPKELWLRLDTGQVVSDPKVIRPVGDGMLTRATDGGIFFNRDLIVPSSCKGIVIDVLPDPLRVLAACAGAGRERPVESFGKSVRVKTLAIQNGTEDDIGLMTGPLHCSPRDGCFDARDGAVLDLHGDSYRHRRGNVMLLEKREGFDLLDLATKAYRPFDKVQLRGLGEHHVLADAQLIELSTGKPIGTLSDEVFFIDDSGRGLAPTALVPGTLPVGPLHWLSATAAP